VRLLKKLLDGVDGAIELDVVKGELPEGWEIGHFEEGFEVEVRDFVVGEVEVLKLAGRQGKFEGRHDAIL
jgi:hypothetical protein